MNRRSLIPWITPCAVLGLFGLLAAGSAEANDPFIHAGDAIHPACVHAIAMQHGDAIPVVTAVSLDGCNASVRTKAKIQRDPERRDVLLFEDEALLGEGTFGYRHLATLDNGIFILGIRRTGPDGDERVSLAAVDVVERPSLANRGVAKRRVLGMIGEVWLKDLDTASLRTAGNVVHYSTGMGNTKVEETIDLSRIARARR